VSTLIVDGGGDVMQARDQVLRLPGRPVAVAAPLSGGSWRHPLPRLDAGVLRGLVGIVVARLAVNGGIRVVYPFLAVIARGLGVSFEMIALMVASRSLAGLAGPALSRVTSGRRQRDAMVLGVLVVAFGCLLIVASGGMSSDVRAVTVAVGFAATGLARPLFELPMQTWVSANVPATVRGRALGLTELGWALSLAVTVPLAGLLIGAAGWRSPFLLVAGLAAVGAVALATCLPADGAGDRRAGGVVAGTGAVPAPSRTRRIPTAATICIGAALAVAAGESVLIVYGCWLTTDFGLSVAQIGVSTLIIVAAELCGEALVVGVADRFGLYRTLCSALAVSLTAYVLLGVVGSRVVLAYAAIGMLFVAFEVTIVVLIAFASLTAVPGRDTSRLLGGLMAAIACGNAVGAAVAPAAYAAGGITLAGGFAATAAGLAGAVLWLGSQRGATGPGGR
jgi:DHA1 family inner membrane transport protein